MHNAATAANTCALAPCTGNIPHYNNSKIFSAYETEKYQKKRNPCPKNMYSNGLDRMHSACKKIKLLFNNLFYMKTV
jgi:hypothetical protein